MLSGCDGAVLDGCILSFLVVGDLVLGRVRGGLLVWECVWMDESMGMAVRGIVDICGGMWGKGCKGDGGELEWLWRGCVDGGWRVCGWW